MNKQLRDQKVLLAFTEDELKVLDKIKNRLQIVSKRKISRVDVVVNALSFCEGKLL